MILSFLAGFFLGIPTGIVWVFFANNFVRAGRNPRRPR